MSSADYEKMLGLFRPNRPLDGKQKTAFEAITRSSLSLAIVLEKSLPKGELKKQVLHDLMKVQQMAFHAITHSETA